MSLEIEISDSVYIRGLPSKDAEKALLNFRVVNPKHTAAVRYGGADPRYTIEPSHLYPVTIKQDQLVVPRGIPLDKILSKAQLKDATFTDNRVTVPAPKYPKINIVPTDFQKQALDAFEAAQTDGTNPMHTYLNVLEVSAGKTIMAALMAQRTAQKTLVLVNSNLIKNNWTRDLCLMYGADYKKRIGYIQGPKATQGDHFTIAMVQTFFRRQDLWESWRDLFGTLIIDECQIIPARTFFDCANLSPAMYRIGITGTPKRRDGLHKIMFAALGKPFYDMDSKGEETANSMKVDDVIIVNTRTTLPQVIEKTIVDRRGNSRVIQYTPDGNRDYSLILDALAVDKVRTEIIANRVVEELLSDPYNSVLIVAHRIKHAKLIRKAIRRAVEQSFSKGPESHPKTKIMRQNARKRALRACKPLLWTGSTSKTRLNHQETLLLSRKRRCLVSTFSLIKLGASIKPLNRLVLTSPIGGESELEQIIGRIRRRHDINKKDVKVIHFVDHMIPLCQRQFMRTAFPFYRDVLKVPTFVNKYKA